MVFFKTSLLFILVPFFSSAFPDTTKIPSKWKNESIIILEQIYKADESAADGAKFKENQKTVFYIRDKYGLQQLSTFNISTYIVPGAEMQIGKIYKKNNKVIDLTTKHLIPMFTKIDMGNRKKNRSTINQDDGQKLAIPALEVGDILEIEYSTIRQDFINKLNLSVNYPTLHSESSITLLSNYSTPGSYFSYKVNIQFKAVNFPLEKIDVTPFTVSVSQDFVDKQINETLSDENKISPYIIIWKTYINELDNSSSDKTKSKKYLELSDEDLKKEQLKLINQIFENDLSQQYASEKISSILDKKHPILSDTLSYLNDLFYLYREMIAINSLIGNATDDKYVNDKYFVNVISRVLFEKKINYKVFLTQADYYGPPISDDEIVYAKYGVYIERLNYFFFNPYLYSFPNQIPAYFEDQSFICFNANKYFYPSGGKKKYCQYGFSSRWFPHSNSVQNLTHSEISLTAIDLKKLSCNLNIKLSYWGKNKNRFTKSICSNTLLYETSDNVYRQLIKKYCPEFISLNFNAEKQDKYLKTFMLNDVKGDGYDPLKLNSYRVTDTNFFETEKPIVTNCEFEANDFIVSFNNYIIISIGKVLGNQLSYYVKDSIRQNDFYIPYKKKYTYSIKVEIPGDYVVENLNDLNLKFESAAGKFETKTSLKGNTLEIETEKIYNFTDYLKKDEKDVKGYLNSATDFTQKRLLLKKRKL